MTWKPLAMPFYRFMIHGSDPAAPGGTRGFYTTRHAFCLDQDRAAAKILAKLKREFTTGRSSSIWKSDAPLMVVEEAWRIGVHQILSAPNSGSTFYDERE